MKNIAFIGVGGVGGYFGGKITQLLKTQKDINIYFVARGNHLEAIKKDGLTLVTKSEGIMKSYPTKVTDDFNELPILDICFICVKQYDLENVLMKLSTKLDEKTKIVPLLNGIDVYNRIRKIIKLGIIFPACVYVGTHIKEAGIVEQNGGACTIIFGKDPNHKNIDANGVCNLLYLSKIKYEFSPKYIEEIWSKYIFIAAYGLVTASENKTLGEVYQDFNSSMKVKEIMSEIVAISKAENINLPLDIVEISFNKAADFPYKTKTSFQRDFEIEDKPDERELFGQTLIDLAINHNISIPAIKSTYQIIES